MQGYDEAWRSVVLGLFTVKSRDRSQDIDRYLAVIKHLAANYSNVITADLAHKQGYRPEGIEGWLFSCIGTKPVDANELPHKDLIFFVFSHPIPCVTFTIVWFAAQCSLAAALSCTC